MNLVKALEIKNSLAKTPSSSPHFHQELSLKNGEKISVSDPVAIRALVACMDMNAVLGGAASHYGGPAAFAELMSVTHAFAFYQAKKNNKEYYELFNLVNDAGHCENGLYALKANYGYADLTFQSLRDFRSIKSKLTGHGESHLFPEGVLLSNGPLGSAFPQAQGLAMADALAGKKRTTVVAISDGAAMEGEAKEAFTSIPGFARRGKMAPFICILSDNNTKLGGRIDKDSFSMEGYFHSLAVCGWHVILVPDGNDLKACMQAFEEAYEHAQNNPHKPVLIHAKTIKGIGTKKTMESASGGHGFPLTQGKDLRAFVEEIYVNHTIPKEIHSWIEEFSIEKSAAAPAVAPTTTATVPKEKIQVGISKAMIAKRDAGFPIVSIASDLASSTGTKDFHTKHPDVSFDIGIAEANMVSAAAGFSKSGYIPFVDTFAQFGVTKGALPLTMASLSESPVIAIFSHIGFQDAADGASHQALTYLSMTASIPHVDVYSLTCSEEAEAIVGKTIENFAALKKAGKHPNSAVFFLGRENFPRNYGAKSYELGKAQILFDNSDKFSKSICLVGHGSLLPEALKAAELLAADGIGAVVVNPLIINRPDIATFKIALQKTKGNLVTIEEHQKIAGFGSILCHALQEAGLVIHARTLAVEEKFGQSAYTAKELYQKHGLDAAHIVKAAKSL